MVGMRKAALSVALPAETSAHVAAPPLFLNASSVSAWASIYMISREDEKPLSLIPSHPAGNRMKETLRANHPQWVSEASAGAPTTYSIQLKHFQHFSKPLTDGSTLYLTRVLVYTIIHGG